MDTWDIIKRARQKRQNGESFYIVFDGACENNAIRHLFMFEGIDAYHFLYLGTPYSSVIEYGPVLATLSMPSPLFSWFWEQGPSIHAGIALFSSLSLDDLAKQLQEILTVTLPNGPKALFRFYDPRLARSAAAMTAQNGCTALTKDISALYSPRYTFGQKPLWEYIAVTEQSHG